MTEPAALLSALWPSSGALLAWAVLASLLAGVLRGFAGFGYSALVVAALAPFVPPLPIVLAVLVLECLASLGQLRRLAKDVDWRWLKPILLGNAWLAPLGAWLLTTLDPAGLRVLIGAALLASAAVVRQAAQRPRQAGPALRAAAGAASGLLNGLAGSGGVIAALLMAACGSSAAAVRATLVNGLLWMSAYSLLCAATLATWQGESIAWLPVLGWILILWPTLLLGLRIGSRAFERVDARDQKTRVLDILVMASACGFAASLLRLLLPAQG